MQRHQVNFYRLFCGLLIAAAISVACHSAFAQSSATPRASQPTILYGAAYYNEYMPEDLQPGRLEKDVALMKAAGFSVVRMGESTWSLWEPSDGHFEYAWMDRIVDAMGKAGIKVIMGTPDVLDTDVDGTRASGNSRPSARRRLCRLRHAPEHGFR